MVDHAAGVSFQTTAPDSIVMVEQWESIAHLEAHLQTPHMKAYSEAVKERYRFFSFGDAMLILDRNK